MEREAALMLGQLAVIIGLVSIVYGLLFSGERDPVVIVIDIIASFFQIWIVILIIKGLWLLLKAPWTGG